jgi:hypothetical protein
MTEVASKSGTNQLMKKTLEEIADDTTVTVCAHRSGADPYVCE